MREFWNRLISSIRPSRAERDLAREMDAHLALIADEHRQRGLSDDEARRVARRAMHGVELTKERHRDARSFRWIDDLRQDVRYALRGFARTPAFAAAAVLTLALGIGATTAIFSVVHSVLVRPLPYPDADRVVHLFEAVAGPEGLRRAPAMTLGTFAEFRQHTRTLSHVGVFVRLQATLTGAGEPLRLSSVRVSPAVFSMLGTRPLLGRGLEPDDERPGADGVVVLSHRAWQTHFDANPDAIGRRVALDGRDVTIVGVMPHSFAFPDPQNQLWRPFVLPAQGPQLQARLTLVGRLAGGASTEAVTAEVASVLQELRSASPDGLSDTPRVQIVSLHEELVWSVRTALTMLTWAVCFVLLIACVNVANLLGARAIAREREVAVRHALGASRGRLVRQSITETMLLAAGGMTGGIALAVGGLRVLRTLGASALRRDLEPGLGIPRLEEIVVDASVLGIMLAMTIAIGVACAILPLVWDPRLERRRSRTQGVLVVVEVALAMALLVGGGLLMNSFVRLNQVPLGYEPTNLLTFQLTARRSLPDLKAMSDDVLARLESLPGVEAAGYANSVPTVRSFAFRELKTTPPSAGVSSSAAGRDLNVHAVSPNFARALGLQVLEGRSFSRTKSATREALVNRALVRSGFLGDRPIGSTIYSVQDETSWEIVGIVEDVRHWLDLETEPEVYVVDFVPQPPGAGGPYFAVRTRNDPASVLAEARAIARQRDPAATVDNVATMEQLIADSVSRPRLYATLLGVFASIALAMAAVGVYGQMAFAVARRTREIGIRMALGARAVDVVRDILGHALVLTAAGLALGLLGSAAATRWLEGMLFGLTPLDPATFLGAAIVFAGVVLMAAFIPARRATRVDPMIALRAE